MIRSVVLAVVLLMTTSAASLGQSRPEQKDADPGPIGTLLLWRADLGLSDGQIARLTEIEAAVDRQNEQPLAQLTEIRRRLRTLGPRHRLDAEGRAQYEAYTSSMRPLAKQLERNMHEGMTQAIGVLSEDQRRNVWRLMHQQQDRNRDRNSNTPRIPGAGN